MGSVSKVRKRNEVIGQFWTVVFQRSHSEIQYSANHTNACFVILFCRWIGAARISKGTFQTQCFRCVCILSILPDSTRVFLLFIRWIK